MCQTDEYSRIYWKEFSLLSRVKGIYVTITCERNSRYYHVWKKSRYYYMWKEFTLLSRVKGVKVKNEWGKPYNDLNTECPKSHFTANILI
jgi:hypothetical protein